MTVKKYIIGLLAILPCWVMGAVPQPKSSMLTFKDAYTYNIIDFHKSRQIIETMRLRQMQPAWKLNMVEGDLYGNVRMFQHALACYEKAYQDEALKDSIQIKMRLLKDMILAVKERYSLPHTLWIILRLIPTCS